MGREAETLRCEVATCAERGQEKQDFISNRLPAEKAGLYQIDFPLWCSEVGLPDLPTPRQASW
jgi:hypothetical protein